MRVSIALRMKRTPVERVQQQVFTTQFSCFTSTKVQIRTRKAVLAGTQVTCFTGTKVQILTLRVYLQQHTYADVRRRMLTMLTYADVC
jgi:hypothetical protein